MESGETEGESWVDGEINVGGFRDVRLADRLRKLDTSKNRLCRA